MTFKDLFDENIRDINQAQLNRVELFEGYDVAKLFEDADPIAYRTYFNDWSTYMQNSMLCPECEEHYVTPDIFHNATQDAIVRCVVCEGTHFVCEKCGEVCPIKERAYESIDNCRACVDAEENEEKENDYE